MRSSSDINWENHQFLDWKYSLASEEEKKTNNNIHDQLRDLYPGLTIYAETCRLNTDNDISAIKLSIFYEDQTILQGFIDNIEEYIANRYKARSVGETRFDIILTADDINKFLENSLKKKNEPDFKDLYTRITNKKTFYIDSKKHAEDSTLFFNLNAHQQLCDHNIKVLEAAQSFLDDEKSLNNFLSIQHVNHRWVEGMEPRQLIEETMKNKLKDIIPSENLALSAKIARKINEYQKNIQSEKDSFFPDEDKIELWQDKINVLQESQFILHDKNKFNSEAFERNIEKNYRWAEGTETTALVEEMKRLKGIPPDIIALDTKISRQISIYKRKHTDTRTSWFGFNKDYNLALWEAKIEILEVARSVLYDRDNQPTLALKETDTDSNWSKGKVAVGLVKEVQQLYDKGLTLTLDKPQFNPGKTSRNKDI